MAAILTGSATLVLDARIFDEYREVLARPKFGFSKGAVKSLLQGLHAFSEWVTPIPLPPDLLPDPDDLAFLELALSAEAILVTGNLRHFPTSACRGATVLDPMAALIRVTAPTKD